MQNIIPSQTGTISKDERHSNGPLGMCAVFNSDGISFTVYSVFG